MNKKSFVFLTLLVMSLSFSYAGNDPTRKRIDKRISKLWNLSSSKIGKISGIPVKDLRGDFFLIRSGEKNYGILYRGKVFTCGALGCGIPSTEETSEYFEFFVIADIGGRILYTEITNYAATHGHEVSGRGWLRQFEGRDAKDSIIYGKNIDAISGATKSGTNLSREINLILEIIHKHREFFAASE